MIRTKLEQRPVASNVFIVLLSSTKNKLTESLCILTEEVGNFLNIPSLWVRRM